MFLIMLKGFTISFSLICAIGAQNAYVLKQGLLKKNIFWVCLTCFLCDFLLISLGVFGVSEILSNNKIILTFLTLAGAIFLFYYGFLSFKSAIGGKSALHLKSPEEYSKSVLTSISTTLGITLLNPHVYLDTVVIIGGISVTLTSLQTKTIFMVGALFASFVWFFSLGYGAKKLSSYFTLPKVWQFLDFAIGILMWSIAITLVIFAYNSSFSS
jgi:L-lysine exporter family protein LysE/ArgO